ncbi:MAG: DNA replication/repair protein RecF [Pedobacter sp.]|nr:MAG: DNA replication/repair protein RecF [Pedobacter sp.]
MWLKNLTLLHFKNCASAELCFSEGANAFVGNNGAGKTNLLDAIHYLCLCKSYFNPIDNQQIKQGEELFLIQGDFERQAKAEKITCGLKKNQKKQFKRNKKEYAKLAQHIGLFPLVMISPYDINIIMEGSEERRRFLDNVISQTDAKYLDTLIAYNRCLLQRNALLKQANTSFHLDLNLLEILDAQLVGLGNQIYQKRKSFLTIFIELFQAYYKRISGQAESVELSYSSPLNEADFDSLLQANLSKDRHLERTSVGIHKDDLLFCIGGFPLKKFGSQGQQKSFLIALKLAQYAFLDQQNGFKPILLLDDIFDKLDESRVQELMEMVSAHDFGQIFITDTNASRIAEIFQKIGTPIRLFEVQKGEVQLA